MSTETSSISGASSSSTNISEGAPSGTQHWLKSNASDKQRWLSDKVSAVIVWIAMAFAFVPLVSIMWLVISKGWDRLTQDFPYFLTVTMKNVYGGMDAGGIIHAILGTLQITVAAGIISVPIGMLTAVWLTEYAQPNSKLQRGVTVVVDVMTGIPSIVAGLFAAAAFALTVGPAYRAGIMGAVALSVLMVPTVVRTSEEMLRLVPDSLRQAAYALGVPRWLVVTKVVLRTAAGGLVTSVMLAVARVIGETAPLLMTVGVLDSLNSNIFEGRMMTLPVYIYRQYSQGLMPCSPGATDCVATINYDRAWAAALVLLLLVMFVNIGARYATAKLAPKGNRR
ncbi:MAG: phosphate ABC transporter permease PstA [Actinomycetaceae bacterium]|nr:phosphate ABC transporter permease PstA [Actinomycetaceae bacterium]